LGLGGAVEAEVVDGVESFFLAVDARCTVELCPLADESLLSELARRGYAPTSFRNVYWATPGRGASLPSGVRVAAPDDFDAWNEVLLAGFGYHDEADRLRVEQWNRMLFSRPEVVLLLHEADGAAVGVATMVLHGAEASMGGTTTLPEHRGRGVQSSLLAARLALAGDAGCTLAVTTADPGGASARNIERAGFRLAYTNLRLVR
jgi:GNAT superfamily N-acetyltransferase